MTLWTVSRFEGGSSPNRRSSLVIAPTENIIVDGWEFGSRVTHIGCYGFGALNHVVDSPIFLRKLPERIDFRFAVTSGVSCRREPR